MVFIYVEHLCKPYWYAATLNQMIYCAREPAGNVAHTSMIVLLGTCYAGQLTTLVDESLSVLKVGDVKLPFACARHPKHLHICCSVYHGGQGIPVSNGQ